MVTPSILRCVMLSAAAPYTALSLKIPSDTEDSWVHAGNIIQIKRIFKTMQKYGNS
ncbi:Hypothetical protein FKW44_007805 [Caligus rogercresseyi]|uniref:Uncharacterized protein n=1 Tax=Caligus rogercresseyi TaxID=217165 RepID=A0A7T8KF84_CALRO|nr:Hypothetical protein FKW44_007805 [Caligus rogercresseyi]